MHIDFVLCHECRPYYGHHIETQYLCIMQVLKWVALGAIINTKKLSQTLELMHCKHFVHSVVWRILFLATISHRIYTTTNETYLESQVWENVWNQLDIHIIDKLPHFAMVAQSDSKTIYTFYTCTQIAFFWIGETAKCLKPTNFLQILCIARLTRKALYYISINFPI